MIINSINDCAAFIGIDGGGSKCRARVVSTINGSQGTGLSGPANPLYGVHQAIQSIEHSARLAMEDAGLDYKEVGRVVAGVSLAGVNLDKFYRAISEWEHPFKQMYLISDLYAACLGADNGQDGAVLIIGTGSCGFAHVDGKSLELGGHGFAHGDKGSGAWIGLEAIKEFLLAMDGFAPKSLMTERILAEFNGDELMTIIEKMTPLSPSKYARLAPLVFEAAKQGDTQAVKIIQEGADYLNTLADKLLTIKPPRLSLLGGLSTLYLPWFKETIVEKVLPPMGSPEEGAIYFAKKQLMNLDKKVV